MIAAEPLLVELWEGLGDVTEARTASRGGTDFSAYADDPVGFARDILKVTLWSKQEEILRGIAANSRFVHYGANGTGKTFLDGVAALWLVYAKGALCIALSPKEDQLRQQLMRDIARIWHQADALGGNLRSMGLQIPEQPDRGILCLAAGDPHRVRGYHASMLVVFLQEGQGLDTWVYDTAAQMSIGESDKIVASGNCDRGPVGEFYKVAQLWPSVGMSALDHPNIVQDRVVIPGGPSSKSIALLAAQYGRDSPFFVASVLGQFPKEAQHSMFVAEWIDDAVTLFNRGTLNGTMGRRLRVGIDIARFGHDRTVCAVLQGQVVSDFVAWSQTPLDETVTRITEVVKRFGVRPVEPRNYAGESRLYEAGMAQLLGAQPGDPLRRQAHARNAVLRFDTNGVGGGPHDVMRSQHFPVESFVAGERPLGDRAERFFNRRAQAFWELREALEQGKLAIPSQYRDQLVTELTAINYAPNESRKIQVEPKSSIKQKLGGASTDYADALSMAHCSDGHLSFDSLGDGAMVAF